MSVAAQWRFCLGYSSVNQCAVEQADMSHKLFTALPQSVSTFLSRLKIHSDDDLCVFSHAGSVALGMVMSACQFTTLVHTESLNSSWMDFHKILHTHSFPPQDEL